MAINQGLVLTCAKCSTKNFLDPYPFWNFRATRSAPAATPSMP